MGRGRKRALGRILGLAVRIEEHLQKMESHPDHESLTRWEQEVRSWIDQVAHVLPDLGRRTAAERSARIAEWRGRLGA